MDREEDFLKQFFILISQLNFEKAKEHIERERDTFKSGQGGPWGMLLTHLPQIAVVEKSYFELGFLVVKNKGFLRKDTSLRSVYDSLLSDFHRIEDVTKLNTGHDRTIPTVAAQLCQYLTARMDMIEFYEKMYIMGTKENVLYDDLVQNIERIKQKYSQECTHLALTAIKTMLILECEAIGQMLKAQLEMQNLKFLPSLMLLHGAHSQLSGMERSFQNKESWKIGFGATFLKGNHPFPLIHWLAKLKAALISKFSLYFYSTLAYQTTPQDMKVFAGKLAVDYYQKMQGIQRKYDATAVMLVYDTSGLTDFPTLGYRHPERPPEPPSQKDDRFPIIVTYPSKCFKYESMAKYLDIHRQTEVWNRVIYYRVSSERSYVFSSVEPRIVLIIIFDCEKYAEKETSLTSSITEFTTQLRCTKIFAGLKT